MELRVIYGTKPNHRSSDQSVKNNQRFRTNISIARTNVYHPGVIVCMKGLT